ncbi:MAG: UpxY family transcription antiterminator [bacterium]|nr:UpxY family transcription antiterminator [bacterium]
MIENNWFAIYTRPNAEKKVYSKLVTLGYNAYLPLVSSVREWSDRRKKITTPLISTFVFIKIEKSKLYNTLEVQGALGILKYIGQPAVIKEQEIENLKILMNDSTEVSPIENVDFEEGEDVLVTQGPFTGLVAKSLVIKGKRRIVVAIEALGSALEVNLPLSFVVKISKKE